jgi:HSP20 family protein
VASLRDEVDNFLNVTVGRLANAAVENARGFHLLEGWFPAVDVYEDKDKLQVTAELAGLKKEDIEISLNDGCLDLSGERKQAETPEGVEVYRAERLTGRFHRSINLPCRVDAEKITAAYSDGILTVTLPKAEEAKPRQIPITVK